MTGWKTVCECTLSCLHDGGYLECREWEIPGVISIAPGAILSFTAGDLEISVPVETVFLSLKEQEIRIRSKHIFFDTIQSVRRADEAMIKEGWK